jgi:hypothetical protein
MNIIDVAAKHLLDELTNANVVVTFSNYLLDDDVYVYYNREKLENESGPEINTERFTKIFRALSVTINDKFISPFDAPLSVDPQYPIYLESLINKVITEIDDNINLRISKWEILNYLTNLEYKLKEIRTNFKLIEMEVDSKGEFAIYKPGRSSEINKFPVLYNSNIKIKTELGGQLTFDCSHNEFAFKDYTLSKYWEIQLNAIDELLRYIDPRKRVIEVTDDYAKVLDIMPPQKILQWKKSDVDLLELIVALNESGSIFCNNSAMTRKELREFFENLFGMTIKDSESKLSKATIRKRKLAPFLTFLKQTFENYSMKKLE